MIYFFIDLKVIIVVVAVVINPKQNKLDCEKYLGKKGLKVFLSSFKVLHLTIEFNLCGLV